MSPDHCKDAHNGVDVNCLDGDLAVLETLRSNKSKLLAKVSEQCGLTLGELRGQAQTRVISHKRWRAEYLLHRLGYSYPQIGGLLNKDHTSVMYGVRKVKEKIEQQRILA